MSKRRDVQLLGRDDVVETLKQFNTIIVTGPQRSGTTIAAAMIANDLGIPCIDESDNSFKNCFETLQRIAKDESPAVVQSPVLASCIEKIGPIEGCAVVWMLRDRAAIIRSQDRIGWTCGGEAMEMAVYRRFWGVTSGRICDIKLKIWNERQKPTIQVPWFDLDYDGAYVKEHPLFVQKDQRRNFGAKQTKLSQVGRLPNKPWVPSSDSTLMKIGR